MSQSGGGKNAFTETFIHNVANKPTTRLELTHLKNSVNGVFYSYDKLSDGTLIYYHSQLKNLSINKQHIRFSLLKYTISGKPFQNGVKKQELYIKDKSKIPALLLFPQNFSGVVSSVGLKLRRTSTLHDSASDEFVFIKKE
ncbi:hypothetical protein GCM10023149_52770 [Mucilaginibacter gynuensis]|uniref:Uncharacterized protein n=2 Tax=Mucilaginibacter gynuensis TaxID=1302236 RepID=A0ABP8HMD3_9SPHI